MEKEILELASKLISFPSVKAEPAGQGKPFGEDCAKCLENVLHICEGYGFKTKNLDGYVGYAEIGQGEELIGILVHLDVVPVSEGWTTNPFEGIVKDGRLYGRGAIDDKGPTAACIHILKEIKESEMPLNKRVRIIFGLDEESGWEDMEHYLKHAEVPSVGFTPDADFPIITGEKGIINLQLKKVFKDEDVLSFIEGGNALNSVPGEAKAVLKGETITAGGKAAHASTPENGQNAILILMEELKKKGIEDKNRIVEFFHEKIKDNYYGENINLGLADKESGKLTMNIGKIKGNQEGITIGVDIRYPITFNEEEVMARLEEEVRKYGFSIEILGAKKPIYFSEDNNLIKGLLNIYRESYDEEAKPIVIGGGTFARAMDNIMAFGPLFPKREDTAHQKDEYILVEDLMKAAEIYKKAILYLIAK